MNSSALQPKDREFSLSNDDFEAIRRLVYDHTGINLSDAKKNMVYSRLAKRLRQLKLESFKDYCDLLARSDSDEMGDFINSVTTNLTSFFREMHHFDYLREVVLPELMEKNQAQRRIRIWSAGCSTGEEPYSLAMTVKETVPDSAGWDIKILATDLDTNVLATGRRGVYSKERVQGLPKAVLRRWFYRGKGDQADFVKVSSELADMIHFKQLNLMGSWPMKHPVDVLFCRNVVIYFDKQTQARLFDRYADMLVPDGHLFIGHSETLFKVSDRFQLLGKTVYRKSR